MTSPQGARPADALTPETRTLLLSVFARYGGQDVRIFGSVARGNDQPGSDVDFLAAFPPTFSLFQMANLEDELEAVLGVPVDVVVDSPHGGAVLEAIRRSAVPFAVG